MQAFAIFVLCMPLLYQTAHAILHRNFLNEATFFEKNYADSTFSPKPTDFKAADDILDSSSEISQLYSNTSELRAEILVNESSSLQADQINNFPQTDNDSSQATEYATDSSTHKVATLTEIFGNESQSSSSFHRSSSQSSSTTASGEGAMSTHSSVASSTREVNGSSPLTHDYDGGEPEGVARGKPSGAENVNVTTSKPESLYQKALALISDTYTLSILIPVAAGIVFASTIIVTVATCRCLRRRCRRRRLCRKTLPDSVKNLRPSDRARLLAESSDEEF